MPKIEDYLDGSYVPKIRIFVPEIPALMRAKNDFHQSLRLSMGKNSIPWLYTMTPSTVACMIDLTKRTSMEFK